MISKNVDKNGTMIMTDGEAQVMSLAASINKESGILSVALSGNLRTDVQPYLAAELQFYAAAGIKRIEIDCGKINAIAPGCFGELLDLKIKMTKENGVISFFNKPEAITSFENRTGKRL